MKTAIEKGWLIERLMMDGPLWVLLKPRQGIKFTKNATKALRFARKVDAECFVKWITSVESYTPKLFVSEHVWE